MTIRALFVLFASSRGHPHHPALRNADVNFAGTFAFSISSITNAERRRSMFPWYVNTALVCVVLAGFWGVWTSSGDGVR